MSTDSVKYLNSVKFLNEKCLLGASVAVLRRDLADGVFDGIDLHGYVKDKLGRLLGEAVAERATRTETYDPKRTEHVHRAEVYVLSPEEMRHVYNLMRDELRDEIRDELREGRS